MKDREMKFFQSIRTDSLKLIHDKKINIVELANKCDLDIRELVGILNKKNDNLFIYMKIYNTLVEW